MDVTRPGPRPQSGQAGIVDAHNHHVGQRGGGRGADGGVVELVFERQRCARDRAQARYGQCHQSAPKAIGTPSIHPPRRGFSSHLLLFHSVLGGFEAITAPMQSKGLRTVEKRRFGANGQQGWRCVSFLSRNPGMGRQRHAIFVTRWPQRGVAPPCEPPGCNPQVADALLDPLRQNLPTPTTSAAPSAAAT